jgi:hypothetical protein
VAVCLALIFAYFLSRKSKEKVKKYKQYWVNSEKLALQNKK